MIEIQVWCFEHKCWEHFCYTTPPLPPRYWN